MLKNVQCPMSNVQCPMSEGIWRIIIVGVPTEFGKKSYAKEGLKYPLIFEARTT